MSTAGHSDETLTVATGVGWSRRGMASRVAQLLEPGSYANLGVGVPQLVAEYIDSSQAIFLHSENGVLGLGPAAAPGEEDPDLVDAGKRSIQLVPGAAICDSVTSFVMIRGGHLDYAILGAFEVAANRDLANWTVPGRTPGVGGAMDLAANAKRLWVILQHRDKNGDSKLLNHCTLPVTSADCVDLVFTDLGIFRPTGDAFSVVELAPGVSRALVVESTEAPLVWTELDS